MSAAPHQNARYGQLLGSTALDWRALAADAWEAPSWKEAAADYHKARNSRPSIVEIEPAKLHQLRKLDARATLGMPCDTCGATPCTNPGFCSLCHAADARAREQPDKLHRLMADNVSLAGAWYELNRMPGRAAASTVEALMFGLRDGIDALPTNFERLRRLSELSETQLHEVCARLQNFKPAIARPWTADEVAALVAIWAKTHA
jgi:hypothetical protein